MVPFWPTPTRNWAHSPEISAPQCQLMEPAVVKWHREGSANCNLKGAVLVITSLPRAYFRVNSMVSGDALTATPIAVAQWGISHLATALQQICKSWWNLLSPKLLPLQSSGVCIYIYMCVCACVCLYVWMHEIFLDNRYVLDLFNWHWVKTWRDSRWSLVSRYQWDGFFWHDIEDLTVGLYSMTSCKVLHE